MTGAAPIRRIALGDFATFGECSVAVAQGTLKAVFPKHGASGAHGVVARFGAPDDMPGALRIEAQIKASGGSVLVFVASRRDGQVVLGDGWRLAAEAADGDGAWVNLAAPNGKEVEGLAVFADGAAAIVELRDVSITPLAHGVATEKGRAIFAAAKLHRPPEIYHFTNVEITTWCNLKCQGCTRTIGLNAGTWVNRHMPIERFRAILAHMPASFTISLQGVGEPTLNPDFMEMVKAAKASGKVTNIYTITNALSRSEEFFRDAVAAGLNMVTISVDSLDPIVAERCRAGTDVVKLTERLRAFRDLPATMMISLVVSRFNIHEVEATLEKLNAIGGYAVGIQPFVDTPPIEASLPDDVLIELKRKLISNAGRFDRLTLGFNAWPDEPFADLCPAPWSLPMVDADGYLLPCCFHGDPEALGKADLAKHRIGDLWRGESIQSFLRAYVDGAPEFCLRCPRNGGRKPFEGTASGG